MKLCIVVWNPKIKIEFVKGQNLTNMYNLHNKTRYVCLFIICLFVCMLPMADRTAGPIKTKLGIGTHVDPGSVLVKVKVKVIWRHLTQVNAIWDHSITQFPATDTSERAPP